MSFLKKLDKFKDDYHLNLKEPERWKKLFHNRLFDDPLQVGDLSVDGLKKAFVELADYKPDKMYEYINLFTATHASADDILEIIVPIAIKEKYKQLSHFLTYRNALTAIGAPLTLDMIIKFMDKTEITNMDTYEFDTLIKVVKPFGTSIIEKQEIFEWIVSKIKDCSSGFLNNFIDSNLNIQAKYAGVHARVALSFPNTNHDSLIENSINTNDISSLIYFVSIKKYNVADLITKVSKYPQSLKNESLGSDLYELVLGQYLIDEDLFTLELSKIIPAIKKVIGLIQTNNEPKISDLKILTLFQYAKINTLELMFEIKNKISTVHETNLNITYNNYIYNTLQMKEAKKIWLEIEFTKDVNLTEYFKYSDKTKAVELLKECAWLPEKLIPKIKYLMPNTQACYMECISKEHIQWPHIMAHLISSIKKDNISKYQIKSIFNKIGVIDYSRIPENLNNVDTFIYLVTGKSPTAFNNTFNLLGIHPDTDEYICILTEYLKNFQNNSKNIETSLPELLFDV